MPRTSRKIQDLSSDDESPEVVSRSTSEADAKRSRKALHDAKTAERAQRKARNRERDQKLKERARLTKGGKETKQRKWIVDGKSEGKDEEESGEGDDIEERMLRAMRDARDEGESDDGEESAEDPGADIASGSDSPFAQDEDAEDAEMAFGESDAMDPEGPTDDEDIGEDEDAVPFQANTQKPSKRADYLSDDIFAAAFATQSSKPISNKKTDSSQRQTVKKQRKKSAPRPKDQLIGGRAIRTLPEHLDARSQASARSVPSARANKFMDQSLAIRGKQAVLRAKKRGWERRPANVGVMKCQGAPHGFTRSIR